MDDYYAVIMAGGGGTRLWPLSRRSRPKQTLRIFGERTPFQLAVDRVAPLMSPDRVFVVTVEEQARLLQPQAPEVPEDNYILEPAPRGTASVVGLAAVVLRRRNPESVMAVLTADHFIGNVERFRDMLSAAYELALEGDLVTLGITPEYPDTGYGYIHRGESRGTYRDFNAYRVKAFREKPPLVQAEEFLASGQYAWNSGMFVWKVETILAEIERQMPDLHSGLEEIERSLGKKGGEEVLDRVWSRLVSETVDYGVMEGAEQVSVIPADDLLWCDIGGWRRLFDFLEADDAGNIHQATRTITRDTRGTLLYQDPEVDQDRLIATLGVEDLIIVDTGDVLLVCSKEHAEQVRNLVHSLREMGLEQYL